MTGARGAAALLLALSAVEAEAAPRQAAPALGGLLVPTQGMKAPVPAEPAEAEDDAPPGESALPRNARFGSAPISTSSAALNFPGGSVSLPNAAVAAPRSSEMARMERSAAAPRAAPLDDPPSAGTHAGTGEAGAGRDRARSVATDAGPPDGPPPPGARFAAGQLSFADAPMRFADSHVAAGSSHLAAPHTAMLPGGMALREEGRNLRVTLDADVLFDFDRAELRPEAGPRLQRLMEEVSARIRRPAFRVEGHTDWIGSDAYNSRLSARRAESVRNWLVGTAGVPRPAVSTAGYGESRPVAPNSTPDGHDDPEGRQRNRRVELLVRPR